MKLIWRQYPGALAASSLIDAREMLMTSSGTLWDVDHTQLPPIATQFVRMRLSSHMSPPMLQDALTLSTCIDGLLTGRVASTVDVLFQRRKAFENVSRGSHWTVGRQLELVRSDLAGLTIFWVRKSGTECHAGLHVWHLKRFSGFSGATHGMAE